MSLTNVFIRMSDIRASAERRMVRTAFELSDILLFGDIQKGGPISDDHIKESYAYIMAAVDTYNGLEGHEKEAHKKTTTKVFEKTESHAYYNALSKFIPSEVLSGMLLSDMKRNFLFNLTMYRSFCSYMEQREKAIELLSTAGIIEKEHYV